MSTHEFEIADGPTSSVVAGGKPARTDVTAEHRNTTRRASQLTVLAFWILQFAELTFAGFLTDGVEGWRSVVPRCIVLIVGVALSLAFVEFAHRFRPRAFMMRLLLTFGAALLLCAILSVINYFAFRSLAWGPGMEHNPTEYIYTALGWSWFFLTMAGATTALSFSFDVRDREARLAAMEGAAKDARLLALRYQLNPHFLFNALNSIAALVSERDVAAAEATVENLSDFLRAGLEIDPREQVTLGREIELQSLYLAVEQVRFADRLSTTFSLPDELRDALVPALILQPLVENAMRHSVARTAGRVHITIQASSRGGRLALSVTDDGRPQPARAQNGTGVGIANVRARLAAHFGDDHFFQAGANNGGGYRVLIEMPLRFG